MHFKFMLFIVVFSLASCGLKIGEKPYRQPPIELDATSANCLMNVDKTIKAFVEARLSDAEVAGFFTCAKSSLESFKSFVKGSRPGFYTPSEIRDFLEFYFIRDRKISNELIDEAMAVKVAVVGGGRDRVAVEEFNKLIELFEFSKTQFVLLNPYMHILNYSVGSTEPSNQRVNSEELNQAQAALLNFAREYGKQWSVNVSSYSMDALKRFSTEISLFLGWKTLETRTRIYRWLDLAKVFKQFNAGGDVDEIRPNQWSTFLQSAATIYSAFLTHQYLIDWNRWYEPEVFASIINFFDSLLAQVSKSASLHPNSTISYRLIERAAKAFENLDLIPFDISSHSLSYTLPRLLDHFYGSGKHPHQDQPGLSLNMVESLRTDFREWWGIQSYLMKYAGEPNADLRNRVQADIRNSEFVYKQEIRKLLDARLQFLGHSNTVVIARPEDRIGALTYQSLSRANLARALAKAFVGGYSEGPVRTPESLTIDEIERIYFDLRPVGVDLVAMDPRNGGEEGVKGGKLTVGRRAFLEGNIFTPSADGFLDDIQTGYLTYNESLELVTTIYSAGKDAQKVFSLLKQKCLPEAQLICATENDRRRKRKNCESLGKTDVFGLPKISKSCFDQNVASAFVESIDNLPRLQATLKVAMKKFPTRVRQYFERLWQAAHRSEEDPLYVEVAELQFQSTIMHYQEQIMIRFDQNGDNVLSKDEVWKAYPIFEKAIKYVACDKSALTLPISRKYLWCYKLSDKENQAAFLYMLEQRKFPKFSDVFELRQKEVEDFKVTLDRFQLNEILTQVIRTLTGE